MIMFTCNTHYMAVSILGTFTGSNSFNFLPGPRGGCYHVPHFTDEEIQAQSPDDLPKVMQPESAGAELNLVVLVALLRPLLSTDLLNLKEKCVHIYLKVYCWLCRVFVAAWAFL